MAKRKNNPKKKDTLRQSPVSKKKRRQPASSMPSRTQWIIGVLFAILSMGLYFPSHDFDFVYDDDAVIQDNRYVHKGLDGIKDIWSTSYFKGYNEFMNVNAFRPIPLTTFALEYELGGLNPAVYHRTQIILYGLTGLFLFLFLSTLLRGYSPVLPVLTTLFFIVHPLHVEVVANIKSRDELLAFLNFSLAAWLLLRYIDQDRRWAFGLSLFFYTIGLFSKESAVTTLAIIPAMLYYFRDVSWSKMATTTLPYLVLALIFIGWRSQVIGDDYIQTKYFDNSLLAASGFAERVASNIMVLGFYLLKTIFPHPLVSDYSYSTIENVGWDSWTVYASLVAYGALIWLFFKGLKTRKVYSFAIFYYFATVSIFTSILFPGFSVYNDRFLYHPVLGICLLAGYGISLLFKPVSGETQGVQWLSLVKKNPIPIAVSLLLAGLAIAKTESRLPDWKNRYVLFEKDSKRTPNNARMRKNYGGSLARQALRTQSSDPAASREYAKQAIEELKSALAIYDRQETGYIHLGNMYTVLSDYDQAEAAFKKALEINPNSHHAKVNLANIYYRKGQYADAVNLLENMPKTHFTKQDYHLLSLAWAKYGDETKAAHYQKLAGN
ncbi:MAG: tetratricopeptide repeat protein [Bacteroidetes bacterium]|nr:MAG: tetratricopeptide repeat protein [Bacteroidota bacterium]